MFAGNVKSFSSRQALFNCHYFDGILFMCLLANSRLPILVNSGMFSSSGGGGGGGCLYEMFLIFFNFF